MAYNEESPAALGSISDDLIPAILLRLPAPAVIRSRAVCKLWRGLIDDARFLHAHRRHRPPMPLFLLHRDDSMAPPELNPPNLRVRLEAADLRTRASQTLIRFAVAEEHKHILLSEVRARRLQRGHGFAVPAVHRMEIEEPSAFEVHGSCDGVLLVSHGWALFAYNPAARRWARLSDNGSTIVGFYAHRPTGQFRVLLSHRSCRAEHWVLTICRWMTQRPIASHEFLSDQNRLRPACESPPALVSGCLHWLPQSFQSNRDLLVFDTVSETFRWMRPPPAVDADGHGQALLELDGMLTMTVTRGDLAQLWVMRDYEQQAWLCKLQVSLPVHHIGRLRLDGVAIVSQEGDVLIQCEHCLLQCDSMGKVQKHHQFEHHRAVAMPHMFKENIVPHDCLDRQQPMEGWQGRLSPPFFRDMRDGCYYRT